ncbi:MAG: tetratricopeptide repeat protein [Ignavibacteria bacterium]|nr:tetratricopeptide repeat protein [Ignavibacteria bacterium]
MYFRYLFICIVLLSIAVTKLSAQNSFAQIDSLRNVLSTAKDTNLANAYQRLGVLYTNRLDRLDSAQYFIEKCLKLSLQLDFDKGIAWGYMLQANIFLTQKKYSEALSSGKNAHKIFSELHMFAQAAQALYTSGLVYNAVGDVSNAVKYFVESAQTFEQYAPQNPALSIAYLNLAMGLSRLNRREESVLYSKKAIQIARQNHDAQKEILASVNLTSNLVTLHQFDTALVYANRALDESKRIGFVHGIIRSLIVQSHICLEEGNFNRVIALGTEVIQKANEFGKKEYIANASMRIAEAYDSLRNYDKALEYAQQGVSYAQQMPDPWSNMLVNQSHSHEVISGIYKKRNNPTLALFHFELAKKLGDSASSQEKEQQLNALINLYEANRKEARLTELGHIAELQSLQLQQKNTILISVSISAVLAVLLGVLFYRQRRLAAEKQIAETEQRLLRTRLNPHLWFNALSSVQHHLISGANTRATATYLSKIASVMRQSLESSYQDTVSISEEVEFAEKYLSIQQMRLEQAFEYSIEIHSALDPDSVRVPSMLLEPFLENTIEHGFRGIEAVARNEKAHIRIAFNVVESQKKKGETLLSITLEDNGSGLQSKKSPQENAETQGTAHRSRAVEITKERLRLLAPKLSDDVGVTIAAREKGGVMVRITLPLQEA